jgi:ABC-type uncharacterized transport system substrate-binding protein
MDLNWIEKSKIPDSVLGEDSRPLWEWVSQEAKSDYLEFPKDAFYSSDWDSEKRPSVVNKLKERLVNTKDIDLLIGAGTQAGQDFHGKTAIVPTFIMTASNPIEVGIVKNENDHQKNTRVTIDPTRYERQIKIFHDLTRFKKLGIIYENNQTGRSYSGIDQVMKIQSKEKFEIVQCYSLDEVISNQSKREESVLDCLDKLEKKVDALYLTQQGGVNEKTVKKVAQWSIKNKIKTFSQSGADDVKNGILMGTAPSRLKWAGNFEAEGIEEVLNGKPIESLNQVFIDPIFISLNMSTAKAIGYHPPIKLMGVVEEIIE